MGVENQPLVAGPVGPGYSHVPSDHHHGGEHHDHHGGGETRFSPASGWRDLWALLLYGAVLLAFAGMMAWLVYSRATNGTPGTAVSFNKVLIERVAMALGVGMAVGIAFASVWLLALRTYTFQALLAAGIANLLVLTGFLILCVVQQQWIGVIFLALATFWQSLILFCYYSRLKFAAVMLASIIDTAGRRSGVYALSFGMVPVSAAQYVVFCTALLLLASQVTDGVVLYLLIVAAAFVYFWSAQVTKNVLHTSVAGSYAYDYFFYNTAAPHLSASTNPTVSSLKRACTTSLGSVCFASLVVALLQTARFIVQTLSASHRTLAAIGDCLLSILESFARYINHYALSYIAIYGHSYLEAGQAVWSLFSRCGMDVIINDSWIGPGLNMGILTGSVLSGLAAFLSLWADADFHLSRISGADIALCCVLAAIFGGMMVTAIVEVLWAGTSSFFVCFAEQPSVLAANNPQLYAKLSQAYRGRCHLF